MREELSAELCNKPCSAWDDVTGDMRLLRFLQGFDGDTEAAVSAVREMMRVRAKYEMDRVHEPWAHLPCSHETPFPHQSVIQQHCPSYATVGYSRHGHPICYNPVGRHDYRGILRAIGEAAYLEFYLPQSESRMRQLHELSVAQRRLAKILMVIDLKDVSLWHLTSWRWTRFDKKHYSVINKGCMVEALARVYVINSPPWIVAFYNRIKGWLPLNTQRKLVFLGGEKQYMPLLESLMREEPLRALIKLFDEKDGRRSIKAAAGS